MAIKIVPKFTKADITKMMQARLLKIDQAILTRLFKVGETFVRNARENGSYNDITGNLRNSIGYIVLRDGNTIGSNFQRSATIRKAAAHAYDYKVSKGSKDGVIQGKELAFLVSRKYPRGYVLIVVAGMEYAAAVESRGREVLTGSGKLAEAELKLALTNLDNKIGRMR
jgi:hypothetical protein